MFRFQFPYSGQSLGVNFSILLFPPIHVIMRYGCISDQGVRGMAQSKKKTTKRVKTKEPLHITEAEWEVLRVLWKRGPVSVSQVRHSYKKRADGEKPSLGAVRTFLNRLKDKKAVRVLDDEDILRYEAVYDRETLLKTKSRQFLDKYFDGSFHEFVLHHLETHRRPATEIEKLKRTLKSFRKRKRS